MANISIHGNASGDILGSVHGYDAGRLAGSVVCFDLLTQGSSISLYLNLTQARQLLERLPQAIAKAEEQAERRVAEELRLACEAEREEEQSAQKAEG